MKLQELFSLIKEVQTKIGASQPYICGGTPRDKYMGHLENVSDIDMTTGDNTIDYLSTEVAAALNKKYNITRKSMPDGHSTIFIGNLKIDFSSNFNVPNIDNILNTLKVPVTEMNKEMYSRDFTCNSLLLSLDLKKITDPTNKGFKDIKDKVIRTCLSPEITLTTNKNRVVRSIYLACKLGFELDPAIIAYVQKNPQITKISTEKVATEKLNEAFERDADRATKLITQMNIWNYIPISEKVYPYYLQAVKGKTK